MPCSYEEYEEHLRPALFYAAGFRRWLLVAWFAVPVAFVALASAGRPWIGYSGAVISTAWMAWSFRRRSLSHWSQDGERVESLRRRNAVITRARVDALLARFDPDPNLALEQMNIELEHAEKELQDRRGRTDGIPRWYGAVMLALLGASLQRLPGARPEVVVGVISFAVVASSAVLVGISILDDVFDLSGNRYRGYVALLRLGYVRLKHDALVQKATVRRAV